MVTESDLQKALEGIKDKSFELCDIEDSDFETDSIDAEEELNISWTSSETEMPANEIEVTSKEKPEDVEKMIKTMFNNETSKSWFKPPVEGARIVKEFVELECDKRAMKYPIATWEFDANRRIFIVKRTRGFCHRIHNIKQFKSLPRWDLNKLADLELNNPSNNNFAAAFQVQLRKEKDLGWKDFKPKKARKVKLKKPDSTGKRKFRLKPH